MKRYDDLFKSKLEGLDFETLENSPHTIFGLSKDLKLIYFNNAWLEFSKQNNGEPEISRRFTIGTSIESTMTGPIKDYYLTNYKRVFQDLKVWKHEYECSSSTEYRVFSQDVYPLKNSEGIIIVNSLKIGRPFNNKDHKKNTLKKADYIDHNGIITQCCNCRKTQRVNDKNAWDWIPSFVSKMPSNTSHSICSVCYDYYWKYGSK